MELASTLAKNATKPNPFKNHTTTDHKEGEQLKGRRNVGGRSCNSGDGTDQRVQPLMMFMMMMMMMIYSWHIYHSPNVWGDHVPLIRRNGCVFSTRGTCYCV
jgi:hypothetical protein